MHLEKRAAEGAACTSVEKARRLHRNMFSGSVVRSVLLAPGPDFSKQINCKAHAGAACYFTASTKVPWPEIPSCGLLGFFQRSLEWPPQSGLVLMAACQTAVRETPDFLFRPPRAAVCLSLLHAEVAQVCAPGRCGMALRCADINEGKSSKTQSAIIGVAASGDRAHGFQSPVAADSPC